jgi:S-adenosylmethionine:tRNA ribosyltransferase-isomerase
MRVEEFDYELPRAAIAQYPPPVRGSSRLMVVDRAAKSWSHSDFSRLADWLRRDDLLVRNDARVIRARLRGEREGGGRVEVLLLRREAANADGEVWTCLARPGRRLRPGAHARFAAGVIGEWLDNSNEDGIRRVRLRGSRPILGMLDEIGEVPLPPYIERGPTESDATAYQTVYATSPGAVAAPTAGLHFSEDTLRGLERRGVETRSLTLHVGPGTFLPLRVEEIEAHRMLSEHAEIPADTSSAVAGARAAGRRIVAVGTTTVRALEGLLADFAPGARRGEVSLFIIPGFRFRVVDALITNFHLPRSTLLMLVAAFAGRDLVLAAYRAAVAEGYRFYSYGDAMLII